MSYKIGIDAGSTTVKLLVRDDENNTVYQSYERHFSKIREVIIEQLKSIKDILVGKELKVAITGSAGYGVSKETNIDFVQEVFATTLAVKRTLKDVDVAIELGGEDAKIIFLTGGFEERMNSSCAGGTGAFIDQMAHLLNVTGDELDELSLKHQSLYPIASRCGVFAKTDVQPLLNQGAKKEDIAASIFQSVADQTIGGLAQGRDIKGKILFLGGPLHFYKGLRERFMETLKLDEEHGILPDNAQVFVALGASIYANEQKKSFDYEELINLLEDKSNRIKTINIIPSLFESEADYEAFKERHNKASVKFNNIEDYEGDAYLGIDAGSTTTKIVLLDEEENIIYKYYSSNKGNPVEVVRKQLLDIYDKCGDKIKIKSSAVTGYGEDLIKSGFSIDFGIVETVAHFLAGKHFNPKVDFILDIGGQDMKCFKIKNGAIDSIMLNEACSAGCGSFIESFANQMGYDVKEFAKMALFAEGTVELGSKCTVFMNSSVKQAQKDGATIRDISAGLSVSVVKNALYKVIRVRSPKELGENILVQGGTMYNDAILRSFEMELGRNVVRPNIAGLMGAYGAALYAKENMNSEESSILKIEELTEFNHSSKSARCGLCTNRCNLTINIFGGNKRYLSGNKCSKPEGKGIEKDLPDIYQFKYEKLRALENNEGKRGTVGIPMVLNYYETLPYWFEFFKSLDISVVISDQSSKKLYVKGQHTIPSDTVCYPAKLVHGHIESLLEKGINNIFYPCMTYNIDEGLTDTCYNCPVVAYYPELISGNVKALSERRFMYPYISFANEKALVKNLYNELVKAFPDLTEKEIKMAVRNADVAYKEFKDEVRTKGQEAIKYARENNLPIIVLAGRPYHVDEEINHGIHKALTSLDTVVITEDSIASKEYRPHVNILNQWSYQGRLYSAAAYVAENKDMNLIQLVSFGCGTDAITSDEVKDILERNGKVYTQIKIDETNNLGAAKIRIRSMLEAIAQKEKQ
ncbi:MAG: acyl-CoA dehydratase activase-related protein [Sarcina sp.]